jgi:S-DNA-T family DNA segregation ATPase FtsK/SpoIIIE
MAKKSTKKARKEPSKFAVQIKQLTADTKEITDDPTTKIFGSLLVVMIGFFAGIAILSYYQNWTQDFSLSTTSSGTFTDPGYVGNIFGRLGNAVGTLLVLKGFGLAGLLLPLWLMLYGLKHAFALKRIKPWVLFNHFLVNTLLISIFLGWLASEHPSILSGLSGFYLYLKLALYLGRMGVLLVLFTVVVLYIVVALKIRSLTFSWRAPKPMQSAEDSSAETNQNTTDEIDLMPEDYSTSESIVLAPESEEEILPEPVLVSQPIAATSATSDEGQDEDASALDVVVAVHQEAIEDDKSINKKVKDFV